MNIKWIAVWALLLSLASDSAASSARSRRQESVSPLESSKGDTNVIRKRIESYLDMRLKRIEDAHQARVEFLDKESDSWQTFWDKLRDDRKLFEVRIARQRLDLFSSLASLDQRDHAITIADFERMQSNVIKAFELQQKQKMADFFAAREARWKEFASAQERERMEFVTDAETGWQEHKSSLKDTVSARSGTASHSGLKSN
jgi:hypothetical protein